LLRIVVAGAILLSVAGCTSQPDTRLSPWPDHSSVVSLQGLVARHPGPWAWNLEGIGCVTGPDDLVVDSVTLHPPTAGLALTGWGGASRTRPVRTPLAVFPMGHRSLGSFGFDNLPWTSHCPHGDEQFAVALALTGRSPGTTAGVDLNFTNGTSLWIPVGMGLCWHWCPKGLTQQVMDAIDAQR